MRFLVDECTGPAVARWLRSEGHEVYSVYDQARGLDDVDVILKAYQESWILITNDKDFGVKVYRENYAHHGVIFMRLEDERYSNKIEVLRHFLERYSDRIIDKYVVVTEKKVRFTRS